MGTGVAIGCVWSLSKAILIGVNGVRWAWISVYSLFEGKGSDGEECVVVCSWGWEFCSKWAISVTKSLLISAVVDTIRKRESCHPWLLKDKTRLIHNSSQTLSVHTSRLHEITNGQVLEEKHSQEEAAMESS